MCKFTSMEKHGGNKTPKHPKQSLKSLGFLVQKVWNQLAMSPFFMLGSWKSCFSKIPWDGYTVQAVSFLGVGFCDRPDDGFPAKSALYIYINWTYPPSSNSHQQDYYSYIFSRGSLSTFTCTVTGWGVDPLYKVDYSNFGSFSSYEMREIICFLSSPIGLALYFSQQKTSKRTGFFPLRIYTL